MKQRELKFKIWDHTAKVWLEDDVMMSCDGRVLDRWYFLGGMEIPDRYRVVQYTNFKDVNGKEIYEGDILKRYDTWLIDKRTDEVYTSVVRFHPYPNGWSGFNYAFGECDPYDYDTYTTKCEVIGNVFENPELLSLDFERGDFSMLKWFGLSYDSKNE